MAGRAAAGRLQRQCVSNLVYENAWVCITAPLAEGAVLQTAAGSGTLPALLSPLQRQHHRHLAALSAGAARETVIDAMRRPHAPKGRATRFSAYRSRLPRVRKYGPALRDVDPEAFERMRLVVGYYDGPGAARRGRQPPPPPTHVTLNNLQSLTLTAEADPYYRLAMLSYRSKLANLELLPALATSRAFLARLASAPTLVDVEALGAAAAAAAAVRSKESTKETTARAQQQQQQQQQQGDK